MPARSPSKARAVFAGESRCKRSHTKQHTSDGVTLRWLSCGGTRLRLVKFFAPGEECLLGKKHQPVKKAGAEVSMKRIAFYALDAARSRGASYADVRVIETKYQTIETKNLDVAGVNNHEFLNLGVRVLVNGGWGFAAAASLSNAGISKAVDRAIEAARVSSRCLSRDQRVVLAPVEKHEATWNSPCITDPFAVSLETKVGILLAAAKIMRRRKHIDLTTGQMTFSRDRKLFVSSVGSCIEQNIISSGCGMDASGFDEDGRYQTRSYPTSFGGQYANSGYELIEQWDLVGNAERIAEEAMELCAAPVCPEITTNVILESSQLGLQIHESCGHATEGDRALGEEVNYAGTTFLLPNLRGKLQYGSKIVNLVADATIPGGLGSYGFDDEGVPGQRIELISQGQFVGYQTSRETAHKLKTGRSSGGMRAESASFTPLIRMSNVSLLEGDGGTESDLIGDVTKGIYLATNRSWSIDDRRLNFQFGVEYAREIKKGKLGKVYRDASYYGMTPKFWGNCVRICSSGGTVWGVPNCGKAQPCQSIGTGHGAPPALFRRTKVGVAIPTFKPRKRACAQ